jgi:hypothetical protein
MDKKEDCIKLLKMGKITMGNSTLNLEKCRVIESDSEEKKKETTPKSNKKINKKKDELEDKNKNNSPDLQNSE